MARKPTLDWLPDYVQDGVRRDEPALWAAMQDGTVHDRDSWMAWWRANRPPLPVVLPRRPRRRASGLLLHGSRDPHAPEIDQLTYLEDGND